MHFHHSTGQRAVTIESHRMFWIWQCHPVILMDAPIAHGPWGRTMNCRTIFTFAPVMALIAIFGGTASYTAGDRKEAVLPRATLVQAAGDSRGQADKLEAEIEFFTIN